MDALSELFKPGSDASCGPQQQFGINGHLLPNLLAQGGGGAASQAHRAATQHWAADARASMAMGGAPRDQNELVQHNAARFGGPMSPQLPVSHAAHAHAAGVAANRVQNASTAHNPMHQVPIAANANSANMQAMQMAQMQMAHRLRFEHHMQQQHYMLQQQQALAHERMQRVQHPEPVGDYGPQSLEREREVAQQAPPKVTSIEEFWKATTANAQPGDAMTTGHGWADAQTQARMRDRVAMEGAGHEGECYYDARCCSHVLPRLNPLRSTLSTEKLAGDSSTDVTTAIASGQVSKIMERSEDDRVRNSQFLKFMRGLNIGALEIQGNTVVEKAQLDPGIGTPYGAIDVGLAPSAAHGDSRSFPGDSDASAWHADPGPRLHGDVDVTGAMRRSWQGDVGMPQSSATAPSTSDATSTTKPALLGSKGPAASGPIPPQSVQRHHPAVARAHELYAAGHIQAALDFCRYPPTRRCDLLYPCTVITIVVANMQGLCGRGFAGRVSRGARACALLCGDRTVLCGAE